MEYSLKEIIKSAGKMYSFTYSQSCTNYEGRALMGQPDADMQAGFEDDIVGIVDVAGLLKQLSWRKRFVFVKRCLGYENWQIAEILHKSEPTIERDFRYSKRILKKMMAGEVV